MQPTTMALLVYQSPARAVECFKHVRRNDARSSGLLFCGIADLSVRGGIKGRIQAAEISAGRGVEHETSNGQYELKIDHVQGDASICGSARWVGLQLPAVLVEGHRVAARVNVTA